LIGSTGKCTLPSHKATEAGLFCRSTAKKLLLNRYLIIPRKGGAAERRREKGTFRLNTEYRANYTFSARDSEVEMIIIVEIEQDQQETKVFEIELNDAEAELTTFLRPVADKTGIPVEELILDLGAGDIQFQPGWKVGQCVPHGHKWRHRRVCIDLHFESEEAKHDFPARAPWARVHHWGCKHFDVPNDACSMIEHISGITGVAKRCGW
jgi:hypothetical protein